MGIIFSCNKNFFFFYLFLILISFFIVYLKSNISLLILSAIIFFSGITRISLKKFDSEIKQEINITGIIYKLDNFEKYLRLTVKSKENNFLFNKKILVYIYKNNKNNLDFKVSPGSKVIITGLLKLPDIQRNPGCFDEQKYFLSNNISYKISSDKIKNLGVDNKFIFYLDLLKTKLYQSYKIILGDRKANILNSIILGDKTSLDYQTSELFKTSGMYHILAISGLHISILVSIVDFFLSIFFHKRLASIFTILILFFYLNLSGVNLSTARAFIMTILFIISKFINRDYDLLNSISLTIIIFLTINPYFIYNLAFVYSFSSVLAIAILNKKIEKLFNAKNNFLKNYLISNISVNLITWMITAYYFFYITPYSIIANLIILPTMSFLMFFNFLTSILCVINLNLAKVSSVVIYSLLDIYELILKILTDLPYAKILTGKINIFYIILFLMLIYFFVNKLKKYFYISIFILITCFTFISFTESSLELTMLDVGQGDSFVIKNKNNFFVIDGGGNINHEIGNSTGVNILIPYLNYKVCYKPYIFVSHSDADHITGIIELVKNKRVKEIYLPISFADDELSRELIKNAQESNILIKILKFNDNFWIKDTFFECLYPIKNIDFKNNNDSSLVIRVSFKNYSQKILFTGDIESNSENDILNSNIDVQANILKIAHHGSKTSSSLEFILRVMPDIALISCKKNNTYGHPNKEVLDRLKNIDTKILNTSDNGAFIIKFLKNNTFDIKYVLKNIRKI
ncbi:MAG: DNA internalization-related competence protein ComEC/Rec2 [Clostridiales bacterium]|nr:DNA internalization-related competence protein ComEC/Rec2 [Clostridiales bacterium]